MTLEELNSRIKEISDKNDEEIDIDNEIYRLRAEIDKKINKLIAKKKDIKSERALKSKELLAEITNKFAVTDTDYDILKKLSRENISPYTARLDICKLDINSWTNLQELDEEAIELLSEVDDEKSIMSSKYKEYDGGYALTLFTEKTLEGDIITLEVYRIRWNKPKHRVDFENISWFGKEHSEYSPDEIIASELMFKNKRELNKYLRALKIFTNDYDFDISNITVNCTGPLIKYLLNTKKLPDKDELLNSVTQKDIDLYNNKVKQLEEEGRIAIKLSELYIKSLR